MAEKRMTCWRCPRYNREARSCRDGKANPKSKTDSVAVAEALGLSMLCHYNLYRDRLALRWHFPAHPAALARKKENPHRRMIQAIEDEIIQERPGE